MELRLQTQRKRQILDITDEVQGLLAAGVQGAVVVTVLHTTAAVTTADLDPGTDLDLLDALELLIPRDRPWRHPHNPNHVRDHLLASIIGPTVTLPVRAGELVLGTWQRLVLAELDGPRERRILITLLASA
jgi:secondary thiamine-phosphate synthase enzyme